MFGFKKQNRTAEIERTLQENWIEFAAGAAVGIEMTIVQREKGTVPDDVHYALRAEMRGHVVDLIKQCLGDKFSLDDDEIRNLAHRVQSRAVEGIERSNQQLLVLAVLTAGTGMFIDPVADLMAKPMPQTAT